MRPEAKGDGDTQLIQMETPSATFKICADHERNLSLLVEYGTDFCPGWWLLSTNKETADI